MNGLHQYLHTPGQQKIQLYWIIQNSVITFIPTRITFIPTRNFFFSVCKYRQIPIYGT